ncbi:MAG: hypothetical protein M4D80_10340 [Myxococcota bacterium]|nr:hypothetical protein [Myxococcota bacterium]
MIKRLLSIVAVGALLVQLSCNFAVKHPAITAGIVGGTTALVTCELASEDHKNCFIAGGAVGLGLALIAGFALWLGTEDEPAPTTSSDPPTAVDWEKIPDTTPKEPTKAPPQPAPPDAGVPVDAPVSDAAP